MFTTSKKQRPLTDPDREWHLPLHQSAAEPHASGRAIRMNSTYLELVDGIYANRGMMSAVGVSSVGALGLAVTEILYCVLFHVTLHHD